jgi:two-component system OmpR family sensor kinase
VRLPLRARVTLAFAAGSAIVLAALGAFLYARVAADLTKGIDMDLRSRAQVVLGAVRARDPGLVRSSQGSLIDPDEAFAQVLTPEGAIIDTSLGVARAPMLEAAELGAVDGPTFVTTHVVGVDDPARLLAIPMRNGSARAFVVVGATLGDRNEALGRLLLAIVIGGPIALALASLAGWAAAGVALRPVERMRREAEAISLAEPSRRLPVPDTRDELARLGITLNSMLDRVHHSLQREQRFLDEASHELRTPLSVLRMELDLALSRSRTPEELQDALRSASRETDRLARLAEDLLVLSRGGDGSLPVHRRETNLRKLLEAAAASARRRSENATIAVSCEDSLSAVVDPDRIRQAVDDLVDNALRHGGGEAVEISARRVDDSLFLDVRDDGSGFPSELLAPDDHASANGEANPGLGLAIVEAIARAHGGALLLDNDPRGGAVATLNLSAPEVARVG